MDRLCLCSSDHLKRRCLHMLSVQECALRIALSILDGSVADKLVRRLFYFAIILRDAKVLRYLEVTSSDSSVPRNGEKTLSRTRLMTTPSQFVLSRLSQQLYLDCLAKAKARGFIFVRFQDFLPDSPALSQRYIALRHDIDFAPTYSLEMAQLEYAAGVASTFFVLVDGQFYNPLASEVVRQIREIHSLGHEIGLHFAASSAVHADIGREVAFRLNVLSSIVGVPVRSFSQHDPVNAGFVAVVLPPEHYACVDANTAIRDNNLLYVSDSAMMWRRYTFETAMDEDRSLCLLAHPHSWLHPENDYVALIRDLESREVSRLTDRYDAFVDGLTDYYTRRLNEGV